MCIRIDDYEYVPAYVREGDDVLHFCCGFACPAI
jgi:hypothetical protein